MPETKTRDHAGGAVSGTTRGAQTPRGERRRLAILDAALALFSERGYHATAIADIAKRAEIAKSVIYDHFSSKSELHKALLEAEAQSLLSHVATAVPRAGEAADDKRLRAGIGAFFRYVDERPAAWKLLVRDAPVDPDLFETHDRIQREATQAILLLFCPEPPSDPKKRQHEEMLAEMLKSSISGLASWWYDNPDVGRDELVDVVLEFAWRGLERAHLEEVS